MKNRPKTRGPKPSRMVPATSEEDLLLGIFGPKRDGPRKVGRKPWHRFTGREIATILAALRYWQEAIVEAEEHHHEPPIVEHFENVEPLNSGQIDDLCEYINRV